MTLLRQLQGVDGGGTVRTILTSIAGALKTSNDEPTDSTGSLAATNAQVACSMDGMSCVTVWLTGTFTGATVVLEQSPDSNDGSNGTWYPLSATTTTAQGTPSATILSGQATGLYSSIAAAPGAAWVRARMTVFGTGSVTARLAPSAAAIEAIVANHSVTVSNTISVTPSQTLATTTNVVSAATTNAQVILAAAGNVTELTMFNPTAVIVYVKFYNKATAPTVGTDVPVLTVPVPINGLAAMEFGPMGKRFNTGISIAITAGPLATDTAVVAAGAQVSITRV